MANKQKTIKEVVRSFGVRRYEKIACYRGGTMYSTLGKWLEATTSSDSLTKIVGKMVVTQPETISVADLKLTDTNKGIEVVRSFGVRRYEKIACYRGGTMYSTLGKWLEATTSSDSLTKIVGKMVVTQPETISVADLKLTDTNKGIEGGAIQANMDVWDAECFNGILRMDATYRIFRFTMWNEMAIDFDIQTYATMKKAVTIAVSSCYVKSYGGLVWMEESTSFEEKGRFLKMQGLQRQKKEDARAIEKLKELSESRKGNAVSTTKADIDRVFEQKVQDFLNLFKKKRPSGRVTRGQDFFVTSMVGSPFIYRRKRGIKAEMEKMLCWLSPVAINTSTSQHSFGWVDEWANTSGFIPTAGPPATLVSTGSEVGPTASPTVRRRKGKEIMLESDTPKKKKLQEQIDAQMAKELEEQQEREDLRMTKQIARDAELARIHAEEEIQSMIDSLDKSNETVAKYLQEYQQFASELSLEKKIELINDLVKYQDHYKRVYKFQSQQRKPMSKKQKREYYMAVIKSYSGWRFKDFKASNHRKIIVAKANRSKKLFHKVCQ
uniref:Uncharacterized protein n=1 Tax=Tanacetum cinerariifolium TaxID=118510 RepID=A0A6L2KQT2_TANCI|nr:uncharacterized protein [Tanacetum cinerariifolium]